MIGRATAARMPRVSAPVRYEAAAMHGFGGGGFVPSALGAPVAPPQPMGSIACPHCGGPVPHLAAPAPTSAVGFSTAMLGSAASMTLAGLATAWLSRRMLGG